MESLGKKLNFDVVFRPPTCLLCQKYHPKRLPSFDVYRGKPIRKVRPVRQLFQKTGMI